MEGSVQQVIEQSARASHEGTRSFPEHLAALAAVGVEAYQADYRAKSTSYYLRSGETHQLALHVPVFAIPTALDGAALAAAIKDSQRGELKYPEFLARSLAAGVVGYIVWIDARKVTYFGRDGQLYVEPFPTPL